MAKGTIHQIERNDNGTYEVTCGTILDSVDAAVINWRFVTCDWCLEQASARATMERMPTMLASPEMDEVMRAIHGMDFLPAIGNGPALLGTDY